MVVNLGGLGIPAGTPIYVAIQEYEWDNTWNGAAVEFDVISSDLTPRPDTNALNLSSSLFTFSHEWQSPTNPAPVFFTAHNISSGDFVISNKITYSSNGSGWLTLPMGSPHLDVSQSYTFTASVNSVSLPRGTYLATNSIYVVGAPNNPIRQQFILNVTKWHQTITFPAIPAQSVSNRVTLSATATSDLLVTYGVEFGPGKIIGGTTLTFTNVGTVGIVAMQPGDGTWLPAPARTNLITVLQAIQINLHNLSQTYNGSARPATATTVPSGQSVTLTYNGSSSAPINAGTYTVVGSVHNASYLGSATGTLTVAKANQDAITFTPPAFQDFHTTNQLIATGGSGPGAWSFSIVAGTNIAEIIDGSKLWMKLSSGEVTVRATRDASSNYLEATQDAIITAQKATQTISFTAIPPQLTTNHVALTATAQSGLPVTFAVSSGSATLSNGTNLSFSGAGPVAIVAAQAGDDWWQAVQVTNTFSVTKTPATVTLTDLDQVYTGSPLVAEALTVPTGLSVDILYNGSSNAPVAAGSYAVTGTVNDLMFQGSETGTLVIAKADQLITFPQIPDQVTTNVITLGATAASGLAIHYTVLSGPASLLNSNVSFTTSGTVTVAASQAGDLNWNPAPDITNTFDVSKTLATITLEHLNQSYDGTARFVSASTDPAGHTVTLTYNGETSAPTNVGTYTIIGTVNDTLCEGVVTGSLTVSKAMQATITFTPPLLQTYNTTNSLIASGGSGSGAWNFSVAAGAEAGEIVDTTNLWMKLGTGAVTLRVIHEGDVNYQAATQDVMVVAQKAVQSITFPTIPDQLTTNHVGLSASAQSSLPLTFAVANGSAEIATLTNLTFTGAGSVSIVAVQAGNTNWAAQSATNTFLVTKTPTSITLTNLNQTYTTTPLTATAITVPTGLAVTFIYNGDSNAPSIVGSYEVIGTIQDAIFRGSQTGTLHIAQAHQLISFPIIPNQVTTNTPELAATTDSGLAVSYSVIDGPASLTGTNLSFTTAGTVTIAASQAGNTNWQAADPVTNSFNVTKTIASLLLTNLNQTFDGTAKPVQATTTPSNLVVTFTYNGIPVPPTNTGIYPITGTVVDVMWQGIQTGTLVITAAPQVITNYFPESGLHFFLGDTASLSAQASSGLTVTFSNLTPSVCSLTGNTLTFTHAGLASVQAQQAGDTNWNAATLTQSWLAGGILTNLSRTIANEGGGIEVTLQGYWLGNGSDITNVTLAGAQAVILTQTVNSVTVRAGQSTGPIAGDVTATSGVGGYMLMSNAFTYLPFAAPVMQSPLNITPSNLLAHWTVPATAQHLEFDAGLNTNFTSYLPGYEKLNLALAAQYPVTGLTDSQWVALRIFAWGTNGYSLPSETIWVPAGTNTAYEIANAAGWLVALGGSLELPLTNLFSGSGLTFSAESGNTQLVTVSVLGNRLQIVGRALGTALITVRATNPTTGYTSRATIQVEVVNLPVTVSTTFQPRTPWNPRYEQLVTVQNTSGLDASGFQLLFTNLMPGITVFNSTRTAWDGRPMIQQDIAFPNGATQSLTVVYVCTGAYTVDQYPPHIEAHYLRVQQPVPQLTNAPQISGALMQDQSGRFILETESVIGGLYLVEYMNNFPNDGWIQIQYPLKASSSRTQWIDPGPPTTLPASGVRVYRILELSE